MHAPGIGLWLWTTCVLTGCAMGGVVSISEPNLDNPGTWDLSLDASGVLHIAELSLSVKPQNARSGLIAVGPIVPFVPLGRGNELRKEKPFQIVVQFETSDERYTFAPKDTVLLHAGAEYRPVESAGPFTRASAPRELQRASRGHDWVCNDTWTSKLSLPSQYLDDVPVPSSRSCFVLEFPVLTPSPDQPFQIELRGLKKEGRQVDLPKINFRPGTTGAYSILGSAQSSSRLYADARKSRARA